MPIDGLAGQIDFVANHLYHHWSLRLLARLPLNNEKHNQVLAFVCKYNEYLAIYFPGFTQLASRIYSVFLPLIKTHHYFFASRLGLAAEYKALFSFPFFQSKVLFHDYAALHDFGTARTAYAAFAGIRQI